MGAVEETRKLIQNFLAPELREIKTRLDALEQVTAARFSAADEKNQARFDAAEEKNEARFASLDARLKALEQTGAARHEAVMSALTHLTNYSVLSERLAKLEAQKESRAS